MKAGIARDEREMKTYIPPKGETKANFKNTCTQEPPSAFFWSITSTSKEDFSVHSLVAVKETRACRNNLVAKDESMDETVLRAGKGNFCLQSTREAW